MKKIFFFNLILFLLVFSVFSQTKKMLDEKIAEAVNKNLPEWEAENSSKNFKLISPIHSPSIRAKWVSGNRKINLRVDLIDSSEQIERSLGFFTMRNITPPHQMKIENLGDKAVLVGTAESVEIAFAKDNVLTTLDMRFPNKDKKFPYYYYPAPQEEVVEALRFARVVADAIDGRKTADSCGNDFFLQPLPAAKTLEEQLFTAVSNADIEMLNSLISVNADLNYKFDEGNTALHLAVKQGCVETIKTLILAKANINAKNEKGETPLMLAANLHDLAMTKLLVSSGADVRAKDLNGRNAAFFVFDYKRGQRFVTPERMSKEKEVLLVLKNANLDLKEKETVEGNTLLTFLIGKGYASKDWIDFLLNLGLDVNAANNDGRTALIETVLRSSSGENNDIIQFLISRGADVNVRDKRNGKTALEHLLYKREIYRDDAYMLKKLAETIKILKDAGATE